jgi:hypothetical protein
MALIAGILILLAFIGFYPILNGKEIKKNKVTKNSQVITAKDEIA